MTDLEKHVNQPGRAKLVKKVREKINRGVGARKKKSGRRGQK